MQTSQRIGCLSLKDRNMIFNVIVIGVIIVIGAVLG